MGSGNLILDSAVSSELFLPLALRWVMRTALAYMKSSHLFALLNTACAAFRTYALTCSESDAHSV